MAVLLSLWPPWPRAQSPLFGLLWQQTEMSTPLLFGLVDVRLDQQ
jgi:hypothetical protein